MLPEELGQAKAQGEGGGKDQPGIGHQAVVKEDADTVGFVLWQHLLGAPCFRAGFCSKTIIPDSQEHPLTSSRAVPKAVLRCIRAKKYTACSHGQTAAEAAIEVYSQLPAGFEILDVLVTTNSHTIEICVRPDRWRPEGYKAAQLSLPYCVATALKEGAVGVAQFTDAKIHDPELQKFMQRIRIEEGGFSSAYP